MYALKTRQYKKIYALKTINIEVKAQEHLHLTLKLKKLVKVFAKELLFQIG